MKQLSPSAVCVAHFKGIRSPGEGLGEFGMVFVVRRPGSATSEADLLAWAGDHLAN